MSLTTSGPAADSTPRPGADGQACVLVVGMHRSGTSAATEVLASAGFHPPASDDRFPTSGWNEHGNWESRALTTFNDRLLRHLGGSWSAPPSLVGSWERDSSLDGWLAEGGELLARAYPRRPSVWKDPRLCLLLPLWKQLVAAPCATLFVYRHPLEVAGSLAERNGLTQLHGLALWERYTRAACSDLRGVPVFVSDYRRILQEPGEWRKAVTGFLADVGVKIDNPRAAAVGGSVDPGMRRQRSEGAVVGPGRSAEDVFEHLKGFEGGHRAWPDPQFGAEPPWVGEILGLRLETEMAGRALRTSESSRAYRLARWLRRGGPAR